jgi:putative membrane protein
MLRVTLLVGIILPGSYESEDTQMMWGYGFSWGSMFLMWFGMVFWIALLVVLTWALIRWLTSKTATAAPPVTSTPASEPSALEILRQRYARGEIDTATFEQMRERLEASGVPGYQYGNGNQPTASVR